MIRCSDPTGFASGASGSASAGVAIRRRAPEFAALYSTSRGCSRVLAGTAQSPAAQHPSSSSMNSPQFSKRQQNPYARSRRLFARRVPPARHSSRPASHR
jgi:hypothetical protein